MATQLSGAAPSPSPPGADSRLAFVATLVMTVTAACGAMLLLIAAAVVIRPSTHLPGALAGLGDQNQGVKTTLYVVAFLVVVPVSIVLVPRGADRLRGGPNGPAMGLLSALLAGTLTLAVALARVSSRLPWGNGVAVVLTLAGCWWLVAGAIIARALRPRPWPNLLRARRLTPAVAGAAAAGVVVCVLCVTTLSRLSWVALVVGTSGAVAVVLLHGRAHMPRIAGAKAVAVEILIAAVLLLLVPNLNIFRAAATPALTHLNALIVADQQNYLLGPANQLLAGGTMLVNTFSEYGVASIYFLAGWFHLAPIGYGTLGFLDGVLTAFFFLGGYWLLRLAGVSRLLAACALALGVVALVYSLMYPIGDLPEHGPFRFGLPMIALLAVIAGHRFPRRASVARWIVLAVVSVASVWSIEALAYTAFALAAMACVHVFALPRRTRRQWLVRQVAAAAGAVLVAQIIFALATLLGAGQLPNWGEYFAYFTAFFSGSVANLTYGFARWSPGLAVGAIYLASAISIALVIWRAPSLWRRQPRRLIALAGTTAYGIALYSYFDNRSATYLLPYVALPALLTATLWLALALREARALRPRVNRAILVAVLSPAVIMLAAAWSPISGRFSDSALAYVVPGGPSLAGAVHRLWHPPPLNPLAGVGQRLMARYMPGERRSLVFTIGAPDLGTEILIRARRGNQLPLGDPIEDSIVPASRLPALRQAIAALHPGERALMNQTAVGYVRSVRAHRLSSPLRTADPQAGTALERWALQRIAERFSLRTVKVGPAGFVVAALEAHS